MTTLAAASIGAVVTSVTVSQLLLSVQVIVSMHCIVLYCMVLYAVIGADDSIIYIVQLLHCC